MRTSRLFASRVLSLSLAFSLLAPLGACDTEEQVIDLGFDDAPVAKTLAAIRFLRPVSNTVAAGPYAFLFHQDSGFSVIEIGDDVAEEPITYGPFPSRARVLAVEYDETARVAYVVDAAGTLLVVDLAGAASIRVLSTLVLSSLDVQGTDAATTAGAVQIVRNGQRLFVLVGRVLQPIFINRISGQWSLVPEKSVRLPRVAVSLSASAGNLYIGYSGSEGARIEAWAISLLGRLKKLGSFDVGGDLRTLVSRGSKVLVLSQTIGLTVVDFYRPSSPRIVYQNAQFGGVSMARLFGRTLLVALADRNFVSALDVSDFASPFVLTTNKGTALPDWIALIRGNLFMGGANEGTIFGIPPVVAASVPERIRNAFPLAAQLPLTFSKQIDPSSLLITGAVKLICDGAVVEGTPWLSPDGFTLNYRPLLALLVNQRCTLDVSGLFGWNQLPLTTGVNGTAITFTTLATSVTPTTPGSDYPHTADGKFTDCVVAEPEDDSEDAGAAELAPTETMQDAGTGNTDGACEWHDVVGAQGRYTYFYADFDGENLWILNDWFYNGEDINPDCYNLFQAWTGNGAERWEIRAYGDQHVEVTRNGEPVDAAASGVEGGKFYGPSPNVSEPHTIYEIKIPAMAGGWGVQLHDPGPTFQCEHLESDTVPLSGTVVLGQQGGSIRANTVVTPPTAPTLDRPADAAPNREIDVELAWSDDNSVDNYVYYRVELSSDAGFGSPVIDTTTWSKTFRVWRGVLAADTTYYWRVTAQNQAGSATSMPFSFTTTKTPSYQVTTAVLGQGSVLSSDRPRSISCGTGTNTCSAPFTLGDKVTLMAKAAEGWDFIGWSGGCDGTSASHEIEVSGDVYCAAVFQAPNNSSTLWTSRTGSGSGRITSTPMGIDCGYDCNDVYPNGVEVSLTATADQGSMFVGWTGDCSGASPMTFAKIDGDTYCTAVFNVPPPGQYTLNVYASTGGSITSDVGGIDCPSSLCGAAYTPGTQVTLTAQAAQGYSFDRWTGDCAATASGSTATVTLSNYRSCGAEFLSNAPRLDVYVTGPGSVTSAPSGIDCSSNGGNGCSGNFNRNSSVTLTADPSGQGVFGGWSGDCSGTNLSVNVTIDRAKTCYASFEQSALYVYVSGSGRVTGNKGGIDCDSNGGTCSANFAAGTNVTLTADPAQGYAFTGWSGSCSGTSLSTSVDVTGSKSCTASFATLTLSVSVTGTGTVTSAPSGISCTSNGGTGCSKNYAKTATVQLTAAPGQDYVFVGWSGCSSSTNASISVNVSGNTTCYASFASNNNQLTIYGNGNGNGSVTSSPSGVNCTITGQTPTGMCTPIYAYNQVVNLTATPATNKDYFSGWAGNCQGNTASTSVTMAGARTCYAAFQKNTLTLSVGAGGSVTGNKGSLSCSQAGGTCAATFNVGTDVQLTATPTANYSFSGWSGGTGCSGSNPVLNLDVSAAKTCYATFVTYTLTAYVSPSGGGTITSDDDINCTTSGGNGCSQSYANYGEVVQLTAAPATNYVFINWSGCSSSTSQTIDVTLNGSQSCTANFQQTRLTVYVSPNAGGTVTSNTGGINCTTYGGNNCSVVYTPSTVVTLTAAPAQNYVFSGWSGDCSGTELETSVTVSRTRACYAQFTSNVLTIGDGGGTGTGTVTTNVGSINCTEASGTCSAAYTYNQAVTLTATPATGSDFAYWSGNCSGSNAMLLINMVGDRTCYPVFTLEQHTASVTVIGNGGVASNINGLNCGGDCSQAVNYSATVSVTAVPFPGETFLGWGGACAIAGTTATFSGPMPAATLSCTASFSENNSYSFAGVFSDSTYDAEQCNDWEGFRTGLSSAITYAKVRVRSSLDTAGLTCNGASANTICQALRAGTTVTNMQCDGKYWDVGACSSARELHVGSASGVCGCGDDQNPAYTIRPCYSPAGYNGYGYSCGNTVDQTLSVDCVPSSVTVAVIGAGSITSNPVGISCRGDCNHDFADATEVTLTATPDEEETFLGWGGDCDGAGTNAEAMISASTETPIHCTALFSNTAPKVLIAAAETGSYVTALQNALIATDAFTAVDVIGGPSNPTPPTLAQLYEYDVVLVWTSAAWSNATAFGNDLADYYDGGGRVVVAMYALGGHSFAGRFATVSEGYILMNPAGGYTSCGGTTLGEVYEPASPLMTGVTSVVATNACAQGALVNNGTVVAEWTGGRPMVVRGTVQGRKRVDLNLYLSSYGGNTVTLVKNALLYQ